MKEVTYEIYNDDKSFFLRSTSSILNLQLHLCKKMELISKLMLLAMVQFGMRECRTM